MPLYGEMLEQHYRNGSRHNTAVGVGLDAGDIGTVVVLQSAKRRRPRLICFMFGRSRMPCTSLN